MALTARQQINKLKLVIEDAQKKIAELEPLAVNEVDTSAIVTGDFVTANYGRGDKAKPVSGKIEGIKREPGKAARLLVKIGTGFDSELVVLFENQITGVVSEEKVEADPRDSAATE